MQPSYRFVSHPADLKLRARGNDLGALFANAAKGMMAFMYGECTPCQHVSYRDIRIHASDVLSLLHDWLAELLYLSNIDYCACTDYQIIECDEKHLIARVGFCPAEAQDDIKAVTYSEMDVRRTGGGWQATVVFDI